MRLKKQKEKIIKVFKNHLTFQVHDDILKPSKERHTRKEIKMFYLTYDLRMYDDESICEEFDTIEELLKRYEEIKWEA